LNISLSDQWQSDFSAGPRVFGSIISSVNAGPVGTGLSRQGFMLRAAFQVESNLHHNSSYSLHNPTSIAELLNERCPVLPKKKTCSIGTPKGMHRLAAPIQSSATLSENIWALGQIP
jgi:hypothetical protein